MTTMKKILILVLLSVSICSYAQTQIDPTLAVTTSRTNTAIKGSITASGTDTYTASVSNFTWASGEAQDITFTNGNTGSSTFQLNGGTTYTLKKFSSGSLVNLASGDISAGERKRFYHNGTYLVIEGGSGSGGGSSDIEIGVTTITSGTNTRIPYNNSGVVGEYSISGSGNVAMTTNGVFTTPNLGTPSALVGTNISGTASGLSIGGNAATVTTNANLTGPITSSGNATAVASSINLPGSPTTTTQTAADNSTKVATTAYVDNAILGQRTKEAVKYSSTAALPSIVYSNGSSGVGATITGVALAAISLDGNSPSLNDRVLIKNQASTFQNGLYTVTQTGSGIAVFILTRATDFDQAADIQTGDNVFVSSGTTLSTTTWTYNAGDNPVMGTDPITFVQIAGQGSFTGGNGITITGTSIAIDPSVTVDKTTTQTLTNKTLTSPIVNFGSDANGDIIIRSSGAYGRLAIGSTNQVLTVIAGLPSWQAPVKIYPFACSDEVSAIASSGTAKITFHIPFAMTLTSIRADLVTAQASGSIFTIDIKENGTTIFSTLITIDNTETTSVTAATPAVISDSSLADNSTMTAYVTQVGNGTGAGLKITLIGN